MFGLWYGKGPGLDRSMDVLKHANAAGTMPHGGVLAVVGDDHGAKSSTLPHQSDHNFKAAFVPFLYPSSVHEFVEYGLLGIAMSRFSGCWVGLKVVSETIETSGTVDLASEQRRFILPEFEVPPGGLHIRPGDVWREEDTRLQRYKGFAALAFARANRIDRVIFDSPRPRFGIITSGKSFADVMEALGELGIDEKIAADIGLRLYKVGMPWPLEPEGVRHFCEGLEEVLVVEEKREFLEHQLMWQLYNWNEQVRPRVVGKYDETGAWLLQPDNELSLGEIAHVIASRLSRILSSDRITDRLAYFASREQRRRDYKAGRAQTLFLRRLSAQYFNQSAGRLPRRRRHRLPYHVDVDGSQRGRLHPDGRRRLQLGWQRPVHGREAHLRQPWRWHLFPLRPAGDPPGGRGQGQRHLQDSLQ
ncbi:hypothetical protein [Hankyongella ginsenosidimutans]|uniref:hypothetical protein n=1 Tax=Hankyongella ginsenosidimutans TaxID=1763828 RepID=UPI001FECC2D1|nr:hypothetical protein [Hankyongella ginsenosidimutans]